jgi:2-oxoglutarate ferredoxin oxidoreductase subunit alpha
MSDLDLGMNNWMSEPFQYPDKPLKRGKVLSAEELGKAEGFARYKDVDGDGIPYRTIPGTKHPSAAWFARGSGHNEKAQYTERPDDYVKNMDRLARKFATARKLVPAAEIVQDGGKVGVIAYGTSQHAMVETLSQLLKEYGVGMDYMRLRGFPFGEEVHDFIARHDRVYVVDQNRDGQMFDLLKLDIKPEHVTKLRSIRHYNGLPLDARTVTEAVLAQEEVK